MARKQFSNFLFSKLLSTSCHRIFSQPSIYIDGWLYAMSMTSVVCNVRVLSQNDSTYHHSVFTTWKWHPFATWTPSFIILVLGASPPNRGKTVFACLQNYRKMDNCNCNCNCRALCGVICGISNAVFTNELTRSVAWNSGFVWAVGEIERWISGYPVCGSWTE